jgi:hypothetical protein
LLNPTAVRFARQDIGTTSAVLAIDVVNLGSTPVTVTDVTISGGDQGDFAERDSCAGATIGVDDGCAISIRFTPLTRGIRRAVLVMTTTSVASPQIVPLSGQGFSA